MKGVIMLLIALLKFGLMVMTGAVTYNDEELDEAGVKL
jgi:hypothetical protein